MKLTDLQKPPAKPIVPNVHLPYGTNVTVIHPSLGTRKRFYNTVLIPLGHAVFDKKGFWEFSDEYIELIKINLDELKGYVNLFHDN